MKFFITLIVIIGYVSANHIPGHNEDDKKTDDKVKPQARCGGGFGTFPGGFGGVGGVGGVGGFPAGFGGVGGVPIGTGFGGFPVNGGFVGKREAEEDVLHEVNQQNDDKNTKPQTRCFGGFGGFPGGF